MQYIEKASMLYYLGRKHVMKVKVKVFVVRVVAGKVIKCSCIVLYCIFFYFPSFLPYLREGEEVRGGWAYIAE